MSAPPRPVTSHPTLRLCSTCAAVALAHLVRDRGQLYAVCLACLPAIMRDTNASTGENADAK